MLKDHATIFRNALLNTLEDIQISEYVLSGLANILAIDFDLRSIKQEIDPYASSCATKIAKYLGNKSALGENFDDILSLFAAAIANNQNEETNPQPLQTLSADEIIIQQICSNCPELSALNHDDKLKVTNMLLNLKKLDPNITLAPLLQNSRIIPKNTKEIASLESQEYLIKHILSFLQQKSKNQPIVAMERYKSLHNS